ncbi:MAG: hypothetical protein R2750_01975 [Bacteroidales bacterium]
MTGFLNNIITRHLDVAENVKPYIPGKFEPNALITGFSGEIGMVPNRENDLWFREDILPGVSGSDISENSSQILSDTTKIKSSAKMDLNPGSEMETNFRVNAKESGSQNHYKEKHAGQRPMETNAMNRIKQNTHVITSNKPEIFSSENLKNPIKPFISSENIPKQNNHLDQNQNKKALSDQTPNSGNLSDVIKKPTEVKPTEKQFLLPNERTGQTEIFSHGQTKVPQWLKDWKNESGQESQKKESLPDSKPAIKVNIGRIEVKAIIQPMQTPPARKISTKPKMSLDEYLKKRNGGSR